MINPTHRLKKFVKYSGDGKADDYHVTEERGWLGSGITDCNGVEIFEGDIVKYVALVCQCDGKKFFRTPEERQRAVTFENGKFIIADCDFDHNTLEVVGHVATE